MRKYLYIFIMVPFVFSSCANDDGKSQDKRIMEAMKQYNSVLSESPNGWLMEYFPEETHKYGGYNLFLKFDNENFTVTAGSDLVGDDKTETSMYSIKADMGPTINFDAYNDVINYFSDPGLDVGGGTGFGFEGDYEFVFMSGNAEEIILQGKKSRNIYKMLPLPTPTWGDYVLPINDIRDKTIGVRYSMYTDNGYDLYVDRGYKSNVFYIADIDKGGNEVAVTAPFIYTPTGIKFYEPIEIQGNMLQEFEYDEDLGMLVSDDNSTSIKAVILPLNQIFAETKESWFISTMSDKSGLADAIFGEDITKLLYTEEGVMIKYMYFGENSYKYGDPGSAISVVTEDMEKAQNHIIYFTNFKPVDGTEDKIEFIRGDDGNLVSKYNIYFEDFMQMFWDHSPYLMEADDPRCPYMITFISEADESFFFTVAY